jgi:hypothetical protein
MNTGLPTAVPYQDTNDLDLASCSQTAKRQYLLLQEIIVAAQRGDASRVETLASQLF